jgi:ATP-dependent DNA ligase
VQRVPLIVEAVDRLKVRSCLIDGEAVACDENGLAVFQRLRRKPSGKHVFRYRLLPPAEAGPKPIL